MYELIKEYETTEQGKTCIIEVYTVIYIIHIYLDNKMLIKFCDGAISNNTFEYVLKACKTLNLFY